MLRSVHPRTAAGMLLALAGSSMLAACRPTLNAPFPAADGAIDAEDLRLDHGYALLFDLLADESKVADILAIKSPSEPTAVRGWRVIRRNDSASEPDADAPAR